VIEATASVIKVAVTDDAKQSKVPTHRQPEDAAGRQDIPAVGTEFGLQSTGKAELDGTYDSYTQILAPGSPAPAAPPAAADATPAPPLHQMRLRLLRPARFTGCCNGHPAAPPAPVPAAQVLGAQIVLRDGVIIRRRRRLFRRASRRPHTRRRIDGWLHLTRAGFRDRDVRRGTKHSETTMEITRAACRKGCPRDLVGNFGAFPVPVRMIL